MFKRIAIVLGLFLLTFSTVAYAQSTSLGVRLGTPGVGAEAEVALSNSFGIRVGINYISYSYSGTKSNVDYDFDFKNLNAPILVDWHPFQGAFRLSTGVYINGNEINAKGNPAGFGTFDINGVTYTAAQVGTLEGKIDFNPVAPYLGLGWDTSFGKERGFGFVFEVGAFYQGRPEANLSVTGPISSNTAFINNLAQEEADLQKALDAFTVYPVVAIGVNYRF